MIDVDVLGRARTCYFQGVTVEITYKNMLEIILTTQEITIDFWAKIKTILAL